MFSTGPRHWAAWQNGRLIGLATMEPSRMFSDTLWMASEPATEELAIRSLLPYVARNARRHRALSVNFAAGQAVEAFHAAGYYPRYSLIWMEIPFQTHSKP
jgi:hypothetical protein